MRGGPLERRRCWHVRDSIYPPHTTVRLEPIEPANTNTDAPHYDFECTLCAYCAGAFAAKLEEVCAPRPLPAPAESRIARLERSLDELLTRWELLAEAHRLRGEYAAASVLDQCCADLDQVRREYRAAMNEGT